MSSAARLIAFLALAIPMPTSGSAQEDDTIRVRLEMEPGRLRVETRFPHTNVPIPTLALWPSAGADFIRDLEDLQAFDENGEPALIRQGADPFERQLPLGGGAFTLRYSIRAWKFTFAGEARSDVHRPTLVDDLALVGGRSWFFQPMDLDLALAPVTIDVTGPYADIAVLGSVDGAFPDSRYVAGSLVIGGDFRRRVTAAGGVPVRFFLHGDDWRFSDDDLVEAVEEIVEEQARMMGFVPGGALHVILVEGEEAYAGGIAEGPIVTLYPDPRLRLGDRDPQTLRLVAHEHFHRWLGEYATSDPRWEEGRFKWFQEGVTEYMSYRTLLRTGHLEPSDFVFKINQYIERYVDHPAALTATADVLEREYWEDDRLQDLPYDKGFLLGLAIDAILRRDSFDGAGIEDFVRTVIRPGGPTEYDDDGLVAALESLSESSWREFYDLYMLGAAPLPLDQICQAAGFDCRRDRGGPMRLHATNRTRRSLERMIR